MRRSVTPAEWVKQHMQHVITDESQLIVTHSEPTSSLRPYCKDDLPDSCAWSRRFVRQIAVGLCNSSVMDDLKPVMRGRCGGRRWRGRKHVASPAPAAAPSCASCGGRPPPHPPA